MKFSHLIIAALTTIILSSCNSVNSGIHSTKNTVPLPTQISVKTEELTPPKVENTVTGNTMPDISPIQTLPSSGASSITNTGIEGYKNTYVNTKYGIQIILPEGLFAYEKTSIDTIGYISLCFITTDTAWGSAHECGGSNMATFGMLEIVSMTEYHRIKDECRGNNDIDDMKCTLGITNNDIVGFTDEFTITYRLPQEGPEDEYKIYPLLGIDDYRGLSTAIKSRITPLIKYISISTNTNTILENFKKITLLQIPDSISCKKQIIYLYLLFIIDFILCIWFYIFYIVFILYIFFMKIILLLTSALLLTACTFSPSSNTHFDNNTPAIVDIPTPSHGTGELLLTGTEIISLSGVMDMRFTYLDSEKKVYSSGSFREIIGQYPHTIVYFYPKDGTPNCTIQALDFSLMLADFRAKGYNVIGVSKDNLDSHKSFADRNELKIQLIQDGSGELLRAFGAEGQLQEYGNGHELSDIIRSTYVINALGKPQYATQNVYAKGHARTVYTLVTGEKYIK